MAAQKNTPPTSPATSGDGSGTGSDDNSKTTMKSAFRAALDRKNAHHHPDEDHRDAHGAPAASNDVSKRNFRRKSG